MPMFKQWVPQAVRPWLYLVFAFVFQLTGTYYLGSSAQIMGSTSLMREDVMMIGMMGVVGVNMPFPFLFRFKLRYPNRHLLINAALVIVACNILSLYVTWVPLLCLLSYVAGFFKLCGTFECFSSIRLWISPKQNFGVFLPAIYIVILSAVSASTWLSQQFTYYFDNWQMMNWFIVALLLGMVLILLLLTRPVMFMKPLPLLSLDWLGCLLWSALMLEIIWVFLYGEYYNWFDSKIWRGVAMSIPITLATCVLRMRRIRHPYIEARLWNHSRLWPILGMFFVAEMMNATPRVMQTTLTGGVLHWGMLTTSGLNLWEIVGIVLGCGSVIVWATRVKQPFTQLLTMGFAALVAYQVMMYFMVSPELNIERLYLPTVLRSTGYAIFFSTMTLYLKHLIEFPAFFMALTMSGFIRNGVAESVCSGLYGYKMRYNIADNLVRDMPNDITNVLLASIKQSLGVMCIIGVVILLLMMVYEFPRVRNTVKMLPHLTPVARRFYRRTIFGNRE